MKNWQDFVTEKLTTWKKTNLDWLLNFKGPRHVVLYDQLVTNVEEELKAVLSFLNLNLSPSALDCALSRREGIYKRRRRALPFDPYTPSMRAALRRGEEEVMSALRGLLSSTSPTKGASASTTPPPQRPPPDTLLPPPHTLKNPSPEELLPPSDTAG
ncbi:hypothetical protein J437_LFUL005649 [Ladona fulva]|uniref:Sulfotransferase n=1 Tax=Ladona fulva TaxID=123851 RepID=A0A8K0K3Z9_LADFU|nr:hypothetical protein J437_LFUL005649 [Ladona fulva]